MEPSKTRMPSLRTVQRPAIGRPKEPRPELPPGLFRRRLARVRAGMAARGLDAMAVYADREHFATLHWLTFYDPRFEEALLLVLPDGPPVLIVGNEGMGYSNVARLPVERRLYQVFSLLGQPRGEVIPLDRLLRKAGLREGRRVGAAAWKYFSRQEFDDAREALDVPDFIARSLRGAAGKTGRVTNETDLFMAPDGLRALNEAGQLADFEWMATENSAALADAMRALRVGRTEAEVFRHTAWNGMTLSCWPTCTTGENLLRSNFPSPTCKVIRRGDPILMTMSYQGANVCRLGWVASGPAQLPAGARDYVERAAAPYFRGLAAWYEALRIGATGHELHHAVVDLVEPLGLTFGLNIGHQIGTDEWIHSFIADGSQQALCSGMYLQADFYAKVAGLPGQGDGGSLSAFAEDGLAIADARLRRTLARRYPEAWKRIQLRRKFLRDELGIRLADEVLPFSNFPAMVTPFFLTPDRCMTFR